MLRGYSPVVQGLIGTLFTWGVTALGAAVVYLPLSGGTASGKQKVLDTMMGFAAGVMVAASFWSLLAPAIEVAEKDELYGPDGQWAWVPATGGFLLGALAMQVADVYLRGYTDVGEVLTSDPETLEGKGKSAAQAAADSRRRVLLLVAAITIHNFPEGLAVGVGFGSVGKAESQTFEKARNLAVGIGLQNFPEGIAVSMPLMAPATGMPIHQAFFWGQLSGMVEPIGGVLGAYAVQAVEPLLPWALSFAAGCMIYVVFDDLIPEAIKEGNQRLATWGGMVGFMVMMTMDVALG